MTTLITKSYSFIIYRVYTHVYHKHDLHAITNRMGSHLPKIGKSRKNFEVHIEG